MLGYISGVYDILRANDLQNLDMYVQKNKEKGNKYFALALYDNMLCESLGINTPLKDIDDRLRIAEQLSGIDFTFKISTLDNKVVQRNAEEAFSQFLEKEKEISKKHKKPYHIAYAPGTYDLFHAGHLENLMEAYEKSDILIVGIKSDELVKKHKGRVPIINAAERMEILRHFKFVDNVYQYYTRDPHIANSWIEAKYHQKVDAIFLGSDLKEDFKDITDITIIYTERDEKNMLHRSTTGYINKLRLGTISGKYTSNKDLNKTIHSDCGEKERE